MGLATKNPALAIPGKNAFYELSNPGSLDELKTSAFNKSMNPWAMLAIARQKKAVEQNLEKGAQRVAGQTAGQEANLAMRGGMSSGARERIAEEGGKNYLDMTQELNSQANLNEMQIGISDAENKMKQQGQVAGMEADIKSRNIAAKNAYEENLYNQQMQAWAANRQAQATEDSGKK